MPTKNKAKKKINKWQIALGIILIVLGIYLNRAYAYFFNYLGDHELKPPQRLIDSTTYIKSQKATNDKISYYALGDSLTWGAGVVEDAETYPYQVGLSLSKTKNVSYTNYGVPGARSADLVQVQLPKVKGARANYISLLIGINDVLGPVSGDQFKRNYTQILDELSGNKQTKLIIINIPYLISTTMLPPYNFLADYRIQQFNSIINTSVISKKSQGADIIYVDLYSKTKQQFSQDRTNFSVDEFHPSSKGYRLWTKVINESLN